LVVVCLFLELFLGVFSIVHDYLDPHSLPTSRILLDQKAKFLYQPIGGHHKWQQMCAKVEVLPVAEIE
jgi:hypothetical protein